MRDIDTDLIINWGGVLLLILGAIFLIGHFTVQGMGYETVREQCFDECQMFSIESDKRVTCTEQCFLLENVDTPKIMLIENEEYYGD